MSARKTCSPIQKYDALVSELARCHFNGDEIEARIIADDALATIAMDRYRPKPERSNHDNIAWRTIADFIDNVDDVQGTVNEVLNISCARIRETKARDAGAVYTPAPVADYMCRSAIGSYLIGSLKTVQKIKSGNIHELISNRDVEALKHAYAFLDEIRLIDTSCGTGIFLESALTELCRLKRAISGELGIDKAPESAIAPEILERNLFGADIEPYSIKAARIRLLLKLLAMDTSRSIDIGRIKLNLSAGNALSSDCDGLLSGGFDVIVGNPPYMRVKSMFKDDEDGDCRRKKLDFARSIKTSGLFPLQEGNLNLYKLFIERNVSLLNKGGNMSLIVPSSFLNETTSENLRQLLFSRGAVEEIIEIPERSKIFDNVNQATCIFTFQKGALSRSIRIKTGAEINNLDRCKAINIDLDEIAVVTCGRMEVPLLASPEIEWAMIKSMQRHPPFRGNQMFPPIGEISIGNVDETIDKEYMSSTPTGDIFVKGIHLNEYSVDLRPDGPGPRWVRKEDFLKKRPAAARVIASPRIIGRNTRNKASSRRLKFAPLPAGVLCGNSIKQIVVTDKDIDPLYMMALLNSSALNWYFEIFCSQNNIRNYSIEALPIPRASRQVQDAFAFIARLIMDASGKEREFLDKKIMDAMAYELCFIEMRMLSSAILSSMEEGVTADSFNRREDISAIIDRITAREGFKIIQGATYRR